MSNFVKLAAAALLVSSATLVMAQSDDQKRPARPLPENTAKSPTEPPNAVTAPKEGVGSRPMGPASENGTAGAGNDKESLNQKKLEQQGKSGNN